MMKVNFLIAEARKRIAEAIARLQQGIAGPAKDVIAREKITIDYRERYNF
jgi:hypothetical protein